MAVKSTSAWDSVHLYEAVAAASPAGLGDAPDLDVTDPASKERLLKENVSLFEVFKIASGYDDICYEWVNNYPITFDLAYPYLMKQLESKPLNTAVVHTFLKILSERPDTFIARKVSKEKAQEVSAEAKAVLELGGLETAKGKKSLAEFDKKLRQKATQQPRHNRRLNRGSTGTLHPQRIPTLKFVLASSCHRLLCRCFLSLTLYTANEPATTTKATPRAKGVNSGTVGVGLV